MKRILICLLGIICMACPEPPYLNVNWTGMSASGNETTLGIALLFEKSGYLVGTNGMIRATSDGRAWLSRNSGTTKFLRDVCFASNQLGVIVGESGLIITGKDDSWTARASGTTEHLVHVHFANSQTGMVSGQNGVILKTTDGGSNWTKLASQTTVELASIHMLSESIAVSVGFSGTILRTTDGGVTWTKIPIAGVFGDLRSVHFFGNTGLIVGLGGRMLRSTDGGENWAIVNSSTPNDLYAVRMANADVAFAAGTGKIVVSRDGGQTWNPDVYNEIIGDLYAISTSGTKGWVAGQNGNILYNDGF